MKILNKNIIIAILVVIIIAVGAALMFNQQFGKTNTQIDILNNETFQFGEQVQFQLKDDKGNALSGKTVNITFNNQKYTVTTDQNGKGYLSIFGIASGQYNLEVNYAGDDKYNGCDAKATITVDADSNADNPAQQTNSNATVSTGNGGGSSGGNSSSGLTYIGSLGVYVNSEGIIVASESDVGVGMTVEEFIYFINHVNRGNSTNNTQD